MNLKPALKFAVTASVLVAFGMAAKAADLRDDCVQPDNSELLKQGCAVLDASITAFNSADANAWAATMNFPHVRIAGGQVQVWNTREEYVATNNVDELARSTGWAYTKWTGRQLVQQSPNKLHFLVRLTRYDAHDQPIASFDSLRIITRQDGHWGTLARSSFAGVTGKKTAF